MRLTRWTPLVTLLLTTAAANADEPKARDFLFHYRATVTDLQPGQSARVWLPVPSTHEDQSAGLVTQNLPLPIQIGRESKYGNLILYTEAIAGPDGRIPLSVTYRVRRREVLSDKTSPKPTKEELDLFLKPDARVPVGGKPLTLLQGRKLPDDQLATGKIFYDIVNSHMKYSKDGIGWGRGDAVWACDSKFGNCSDFHSLFISLARSNAIPAKFEMGFPLPEQHGEGDIGGYHCWAKFNPAGRGWIPVDISEANKVPALKDYYFGNLTENRVAFTVGRDLTLVPKQDGPPLNFFIYPYVEVNREPYPAEKIERKFSFRDLPECDCKE